MPKKGFDDQELLDMSREHTLQELADMCGVSRQRIWARLKIIRGGCQTCGKPRDRYPQLCNECHARHRPNKWDIEDWRRRYVILHILINGAGTIRAFGTRQLAHQKRRKGEVYVPLTLEKGQAARLVLAQQDAERQEGAAGDAPAG